MTTKQPKPWAEIRKLRPPDEDAIAAERRDILAALLLNEVREARGISQSAVAEALEVSRARVSAIERAGEDLRLSTIARYVEALGGRLEVRAVFADDDCVGENVQPLELLARVAGRQRVADHLVSSTYKKETFEGMKRTTTKSVTKSGTINSTTKTTGRRSTAKKP